MSTANYLSVWAIYLLGCAGLAAAVWWATKNWARKDISRLLVVITAVVLVTPYTIDKDLSFLAPAWVMVIMEGISGKGYTAWRAGTPLIMALLGTVLCAMAYELWQRKRRNEPVAMPAQDVINTEASEEHA
jgi:amino acid transporter